MGGHSRGRHDIISSCPGCGRNGPGSRTCHFCKLPLRSNHFAKTYSGNGRHRAVSRTRVRISLLVTFFVLAMPRNGSEIARRHYPFKADTRQMRAQERPGRMRGMQPDLVWS